MKTVLPKTGNKIIVKVNECPVLHLRESFRQSVIEKKLRPRMGISSKKRLWSILGGAWAYLSRPSRKTCQQ